MINEDKQFDDFLRSRFEQKTFEQKDQYWMNAQELISAQRSSRSRVFLTVMLSAVVFTSLSVGLLWNTFNRPVAAESTASITGSGNRATGKTLAYSGSFNANTPSSEINNITPVNAANTGSDHTGLPSGKAAENHPSGRNTGNNIALLASYSAEHASNEAGTTLDHPTLGSHNLKKDARRAHSRKTIEADTKINDALTMGLIGSRLYRPQQSSRTAIDSFNKKDALLAYSIRKQKSFLTVEAGINCYNLNKDALTSFNFQAGLRYYYFVSPKIGLSTGISYSRQHQDLATRTYRDVDYSFGRSSVDTKITTLRLDYIELPVSMHYRVTGNHFATVGALMSYAIRSSEYIEQGSPNGTKDNGYMSAINKFDVQLNVGYNCFINDRYTFSAGYYFGLMDISNNTAFKSDKFDRNTGVRFSLGYKLF